MFLEKKKNLQKGLNTHIETRQAEEVLNNIQYQGLEPTTNIGPHPHIG